MPYHRTENGVKTSAEAQLKPPSSLSPFLLALLLGLPPRVVILVNYESCSPAPSATGPNARHACRHCALPPLPPPLTLPGMPCNSSHGHGAAEQHAEHTGVLIVIVHIVILVVAVVGLRVCAKNSQFIPE